MILKYNTICILKSSIRGGLKLTEGEERDLVYLIALTEQLCFIRQLPRIRFSANNLKYCGISLHTVPGTAQRKEIWAPGPLQSPASSPSPGINT